MVTEEVAIAPTDTPADAAVTATPANAAATAAPTQAVAVAAGSGDTKWLIMLYQDADDKVLEKDIFVDLNEAERAGSSSNVQIVEPARPLSRRLSGRRRLELHQALLHQPGCSAGRSMRSQEVADLGEVNMADGATLVDFVTWAMQKYPADKYVLILSDHGMGWPGGWSDPTAPGGSKEQYPTRRAPWTTTSTCTSWTMRWAKSANARGWTSSS